MAVKVMFFAVALVVIMIARRIAIAIKEGTLTRVTQKFKGDLLYIRDGFDRYVFKKKPGNSENNTIAEKNAKEEG